MAFTVVASARVPIQHPRRQEGVKPDVGPGMQSALLVRQIVLVTVPGLDLATQRAHKANMPFCERVLGRAAPCNIDSGTQTPGVTPRLADRGPQSWLDSM
jgi:hypothetical protein